MSIEAVFKLYWNILHIIILDFIQWINTHFWYSTVFSKNFHSITSNCYVSLLFFCLLRDLFFLSSTFTVFFF